MFSCTCVNLWLGYIAHKGNALTEPRAFLSPSKAVSSLIHAVVINLQTEPKCIHSECPYKKALSSLIHSVLFPVNCPQVASADDYSSVSVTFVNGLLSLTDFFYSE